VNAALREVTTSSVLAAGAEAVWERAVSPEGVNFELRPWLKMTVPAHLRGVGIDDVELNRPLGRSWLLALGMIPFDCDNLVLVERGPGFRFLESSSMASMKKWQHERAVHAVERGCELTDTVRFELRWPLAFLPGATKIALMLVAAIFRHRHRRARAFFGEGEIG
jgi:hypothetical protein